MGNSVVTKRDGSVLEIILNLPDRHNAMNPEMFLDAIRCMEEACDPEIRVVLLKGEGKSFSVGGDIKLFAKLANSNQTISPEMLKNLNRWIESIRHLDKPVVAMVHGACAGAGMSLALACDLVIASDDTKFHLGYVGIGLSPDGGASYYLPRHVGLKKAMEIFLTGKLMTADEVFELGLINRVVESEKLFEEVRQMTQLLAQGPTQSYAKIKYMLNQSFDNPLHDQLEIEGHLICESSKTEDFKNAVNAFLNKQVPEFVGK